MTARYDPGMDPNDAACSRDSAVADAIDRGEFKGAFYGSMTLEEEALNGGWTRITQPVGGQPIQAPTAGMRGDLDADNDQRLVFPMGLPTDKD